MIDFRSVRIHLAMSGLMQGRTPLSAFYMYSTIASLATWNWSDAAQDTGGVPVAAALADIFKYTEQPLPAIDGRIIVHTEDVGGIRLLSYEWEGGIIHGVTGSLVEDAEPTLLRVEGDLMFLGPYRFRILGYSRPSDVYFLRMLPDEVKRIDLR